MSDQIRRKSKYLSWLLRHGAKETGLTMDAAGWAPIPEVLAVGRMSRATLDTVVRLNNKNRLQVDGGRIRASQGHSLEGTPVTLDALEASWDVWAGRGPVWHGTRMEVLDSIARTGIRAQSRTHVHLADALSSTVGKRANVAVMLQIDPAALRATGNEVYVSPNGVVLVRWVPARCIVGVRAMTRRAQRQHAHIRETLGLAATGS